MEEDDYDEEVKSKKVRVSEIASSQLRPASCCVSPASCHTQLCEPCTCHTKQISRLFSKYTAIYS